MIQVKKKPELVDSFLDGANQSNQEKYSFVDMDNISEKKPELVDPLLGGTNLANQEEIGFVDMDDTIEKEPELVDSPFDGTNQANQEKISFVDMDDASEKKPELAASPPGGTNEENTRLVNMDVTSEKKPELVDSPLSGANQANLEKIGFMDTGDASEKRAELADSALGGTTPNVASLKMSSSLKERLKRRSKSFSSPFSEFRSSPLKDRAHLGVSSSLHGEVSPEEIPSLSLEDIENCNDRDLLQKMNLNLRKKISENEKKLGKLEQAEKKKMHYDEMIISSQRWLSTLQLSSMKLHELLPEFGTLKELLDYHGADYKKIEFDPERDNFS